MSGRCLAVLPDDATADGEEAFVKVADFNSIEERFLFFSPDSTCTFSMSIPSEWQTRAVVDTTHGNIPHSYFPPMQDYTAQFMFVLALLPRDILAAKPRLLILGGGGGLLATLYRQTLPGAVIDVVEPSKAVLTLAQRYFGLQCADATQCHHMGAQGFVRQRGEAQQQEAAYDLIVVDAFENAGDESYTPRAWSRREWCAKLAALLHAGHGVLAANLYTADETSAPFRAHCDALIHPAFGSRVILQPGSSRRPLLQPEAAQTIEAWSSFTGELTASRLQQRVEKVLRRRDAASAAELSLRVRTAWGSLVVWDRSAHEPASTLEHMPRTNPAGHHDDDGQQLHRPLLHAPFDLGVGSLALALGMTLLVCRAARLASGLSRRLNLSAFQLLLVCALASVVGYGVIATALGRSRYVHADGQMRH